MLAKRNPRLACLVVAILALSACGTTAQSGSQAPRSLRDPRGPEPQKERERSIRLSSRR